MDTRHTSGIGHRLWILGTLTLGLAAACSSSSNSGSGNDAGGGSGSSSGSSSDAGSMGVNAMCGALQTAVGGGMTTAGTCPSGQTCCTTATLTSITATCVPVGQCAGVSNECNTMADCSGGMVCCAGAATDAGGEGGAPGGIGSFISQLDTSCQASCLAGQTQRCSSSDECPTGETCVAAFGGGFTRDAGAGGDAASPTVPMFCVKPRPDAGVPDASTGMDAGRAPEVDSGTDASDQ